MKVDIFISNKAKRAATGCIALLSIEHKLGTFARCVYPDFSTHLLGNRFLSPDYELPSEVTELFNTTCRELEL